MDFSPREWHDLYDSKLKTLGWESCPEEPGIYKKPSSVEGEVLLLSVYVDDNLLGGPCLKELDNEIAKILAIFPGAEVPPVKNTWDILGAEVEYNRDTRELNITMKTYIEKLVSKFNMVGHKPTYSPSFSETALNDSTNTNAEDTSFPLRQLLGALQWVCTVARPDCLQCVNTLARTVGGGTHTRAAVTAAKKILKYLSTTSSMGLHYSPESEAEFNRIYGHTDSDFHLFSDASFGNCTKTLKSTSGSIMYYRSVPIAWRSNRQSIRAYSTAEAEYVAGADTLILETQQGFSNFFRPQKAEAPLWIDNQSAITIASTSDLHPKSKHFALRYMRLKDESHRIFYCPTQIQKADALTKAVPFGVRHMIFHHTTDIDDRIKNLDLESDFETYLTRVTPFEIEFS